MAMPAGAALPSPPDPTARSFSLLDQAERDRLSAVLRPLAWIDGLIAAVIVGPDEPEDWVEHVWNESGLEEPTLAQSNEMAEVVDDHFLHVADTLYDDPEAYRPYLSGAGDEMAAAAQWAAGFRFGIRLQPEPWAPLIEDEDVRPLLAAIFSLERDEDIPEEERADSPFRDMPADTREHMRRTALDMLPTLVLALHDYSLDLDHEEGAV
jgi:yecA family protein